MKSKKKTTGKVRKYVKRLGHNLRTRSRRKRGEYVERATQLSKAGIKPGFFERRNIKKWAHAGYAIPSKGGTYKLNPKYKKK